MMTSFGPWSTAIHEHGTGHPGGECSRSCQSRVDGRRVRGGAAGFRPADMPPRAGQRKVIIRATGFGTGAKSMLRETPGAGGDASP